MTLTLCLAWLGFLACSATALAQEDAPADPVPPAQKQAAGHLITVPLPITGDADTQVKRAVQQVLSSQPEGAERPTLVFDFSGANNQSGRGSDFGRALALARFLSSRELSGAKTVAYIPKTVMGHAVLVAMACEEIIMAPDGQIGDAGIDESAEESVAPTVLSGYREIANRRRTIPGEVAVAMLDKNVELLKVETEVSSQFVLRSDLDELKSRHAVQSEKVLSRPGDFARFSGRAARELGFVKYLAPDRDALAKALSLDPASLEADPSQSGSWRPIRVALKGPITTQNVTRVQRTIEDQIRQRDVNFVCLTLDSPGGSLADSVALANFLAELDRTKVRTVAFISGEALADAALIATAADQLVMRPHAKLGGQGAIVFSDDDLRLTRETLRDHFSPKKERSWSLMAALVDPGLRVYRCTRRGDGRVAYFSDEELAAQGDKDQWERGAEVTKLPDPLQVDGVRAHELGLARHVAENFDAVRHLYGLEHDPILAEPGWADYLIDALASPTVAWMLLLIGGAALYAELQAPGIGIGGFTAGVCFLLFFWSKHLERTAGWLEILLFAAGVCCIMIELFILPGSAVFGFGGGLLVVASLVLASQTFVLPHNDYQMGQLRDSLLGLLAVSAGIVALAVFMRRYLPHTPFFSHVMLEPPSDAELQDLSHRESLVDFAHLLGRTGTATTQLTPSGKARFGGELVDVIADGEVISRGAAVVVVAVQGNRVVVRSQGDTA